MIMSTLRKTDTGELPLADLLASQIEPLCLAIRVHEATFYEIIIFDPVFLQTPVKSFILRA
jgi:hypothetical protein